MKKLDLFDYHVWVPFAKYNLKGPFWAVHVDTVFNSWVAIFLICILVILGRRGLKNPNTILGYVTETSVRFILNIVTQTLEFFNYRHFAFIGSIFIYILICNLLVIFPFLEEPTKDLNTTLALATLSFIYVQKESIKKHGVWGYIKELSKPIFIFLPLEVLGKLATIVSLSFRLFGNIFGGFIISSMWNSAISGSIIAQFAGVLLGVNLLIILFFGIFESFVQAFVFTILSLTYLSMGISEESE